MSLQNFYQLKDIQMDRILTLQASLKACGPTLWNQSIELNKLNNFCSICVRKIFISKKLWIKMFKNFVEIFSSIFGSRRASALLIKRCNKEIGRGGITD